VEFIGLAAHTLPPMAPDIFETGTNLKSQLWTSFNTVGTISEKEIRDMNENELLSRIVSDPKTLAGKPAIRGTRLSVEFILNLLAHGSSFQDILDEYNGLQLVDIQACLLFASKYLADVSFMPFATESA